MPFVLQSVGAEVLGNSCVKVPCWDRCRYLRDLGLALTRKRDLVQGNIQVPEIAKLVFPEPVAIRQDDNANKG